MTTAATTAICLTATILAITAAIPAAADDVLSSCIVEPRRTVELGAQVAGVLDEVLVARGDQVAAGEVVARLEREVEQVNVALARARAEAGAGIRRRESELANKRSILARKNELRNGDYVSEEEYDEARAEVEVARQLLARARDERELARIELARAEAALALRTLTSPLDGVVVERNLAAGEYVSERRPVITVAQLDPLFVEVFRPVEAYGEIRVGDVARITLTEPTGGVHQAEVVVVDDVVDAASSTFGIRLELANPDGAIPAGIRCEAVFTDADE